MCIPIRISLFLICIALSACGSSAKKLAQAEADFQEVVKNAATWTGTYRCNRTLYYKVQLAFWEVEKDKFQGQIVVADLAASGQSLAYHASGRVYSKTILLENDRYKRVRQTKEKGPFYTWEPKRDGPPVLTFRAKIDPDTKIFKGGVTSVCPGRKISLEPVASPQMNQIVQTYGTYTYEKEKEIAARNKEESAKRKCVTAAQATDRPVPKYSDQGDPLRAAAFKSGLFVYQHDCLTRELRKVITIYSRTAPDAQVSEIEVFSSDDFSSGDKLPRNQLSPISLSRACQLFDYSVVGGKRYLCEPYGWRFTEFVRRKCIENSTNVVSVRQTLQCQLMVMGQAIKPFERGPKQVSTR